MSVHHLECAALTDLAASRKLVFMALCDSADKVTGIAYPGLETLGAWSNLKTSQVMANLSWLIENGYIARLERARPGRRAVFRVFDRVPCCALHDPMGGQKKGSGTPENTSAGNGNNGSGVPENRPNGSDNGSDNGSGLDRKPSVSSVSSKGVSTSVRSPAAGAGSPTPLIPHTVYENPERCPAHQGDDYPPPCGGCRDARLAAEAAREAEAARLAADAAALESGPRCAAHGHEPAARCRCCAADHKAGDHAPGWSADCYMCQGVARG